MVDDPLPARFPQLLLHVFLSSLIVIANVSIQILSFITSQLRVLSLRACAPVSSVAPATLPPPESHDLTADEVSKRDSVLQELILTETTYRSYLEAYLDVYRAQLVGVISGDDIRLFFGNVEGLVGVSRQFSSLFSEQYRRGASSAGIWKCFENLPFTIKLFVPYIQQHEEALATYKSLLTSNKQFSRIVQTVESQHENLIFTSLLMQPVQRLPRYLLLLREFASATPSWHGDFEPLQRIIGLLSEAGSQVEEKRREARARMQLVELQQSIRDCPPLIHPSRRLIGVWPLADDRMELDLLSDLVLLTKLKSEKLGRKKVRVLRATIELTQVTAVVKEAAAVRLKLGQDRDDVVLRVARGIDELADQMTNLVRELMLLKVRTRNTVTV
jgi:hypothetical protein